MMAPIHQAGLFERARPFRFGCYWAMAAICLLLVDGSSRWWQPASAALFCILWPPVECRITRSAVQRSTASPFIYAAFYCAECIVTSAVLAWSGLPSLAAAAAVVALLAGATAQAGRRLLGLALPSLVAGALAGHSAAPLVTARTTPWADVLSILLLLGFSVALADLSYRQALGLNARRRALASRSATLERLNARLEHYVPQSLRLRLHRTPDLRCAWERRWLTVAFVDLVGFTTLAEKVDAEVLAKVLNEYLEALAGAVAQHRGELSKLMGDGVLVAFGLTSAATRRGAAIDCLGFCQEIPDILESLSQRRRVRGELLELRMRAGVASGYCTLGDWGGNGRLDFTMIGAPVNLASRLQAHARVNDFLADVATAALAEPQVQLAGRVRLDLRGIGPVWAHSAGRVAHG